MERIVTQTKFAKADLSKPKRVAAYARVSSGKDAMLHSLSAQVNYYGDLIRRHGEWEYVGVYADEALTGTKDNRENFQRLLTDCRNGKVDMIITKSISRFARNTITLLKTVRELKEYGVDVYFEEQHLHTIGTDGELMLTILASYAQEESLSASENQKWRVRHNFENGMPWNGTMLGYRYRNGTLVIEPTEAAVVRRIFAEYLSGDGQIRITKRLNADGIRTRNGNRWNTSCVMTVLKNYTYTGNLLLQTTYRENHLTKQKRTNDGQLPQYHVENSHEAIIDLDTFRAVQKEIAERAKRYAKQAPSSTPPSYPFSRKLVCGKCGKHYRRKVTKSGPVWICTTFNTHGKAACASKQIPEDILYRAAADALELEHFDADTFLGKITAVRAEDHNTLVFSFTDGNESVKRWTDRPRSQSWTDEMKQNASRCAIERRT